MGFPASYPDMDPPGPLLLPIFILLASLRSFLSLALDLLGLGDLVSDDPIFLPTASGSSSSWSDHILASQPDAAAAVRLTRCCRRRCPAPAALVRELLPATTYAVNGDDYTGVGLEGLRPENRGCNSISVSCFCTVCLCELRSGDEVRRPRGCRHVFHRQCLDPWLDLGRRTCPLCRAPLVPDDDGGVGQSGDRDWYDYSMEDDAAGFDGFGFSDTSDMASWPSSLSLFLLSPPN